jgi:hypothetical protein
MTSAATLQTGRSQLKRRKLLIVGVTALAVAALLYAEWRMVQSGPVGEVTEQDTMCMASRIGLSCGG